ncbi:hypothetical protein BDEG_28271 [Batrachochytrium dendrobatidis JEL423]|uniref:Uncharacterized protein n=1 Tax=Batrachochytrium dendrobatidis (strain JEL423) TaxID=403673 RepID=A0A177WYC3_BATDL|nr:hypothetical protein BDEG_28271 [Batrachochytrium dendrobatidis JEL423]
MMKIQTELFTRQCPGIREILLKTSDHFKDPKMVPFRLSEIFGDPQDQMKLLKRLNQINQLKLICKWIKSRYMTFTITILSPLCPRKMDYLYLAVTTYCLRIHNT